MTLPYRGYSAKVNLTLVIEGERIPLRQVTPSRCFAVKACKIQPDTRAQLIVQIDDYTESQEVHLVGTEGTSHEIAFKQDQKIPGVPF